MKPLGTLFMNNTTPKHIKCVVYYYLVKYIAEVWGENWTNISEKYIFTSYMFTKV